MKKLAEEIYKWMSGLKGPWTVHENEFLPANVCCDFAGKARFINELVKVIEKHQARNYNCKSPIIGQEAVVPEYGLGRVVSFKDNMPEQYIEVRPYVADYPMRFDPKNVKLIRIVFEKTRS